MRYSMTSLLKDIATELRSWNMDFQSRIRGHNKNSQPKYVSHVAAWAILPFISLSNSTLGWRKQPPYNFPTSYATGTSHLFTFASPATHTISDRYQPHLTGADEDRPDIFPFITHYISLLLLLHNNCTTSSDSPHLLLWESPSGGRNMLTFQTIHRNTEVYLMHKEWFEGSILQRAKNSLHEPTKHLDAFRVLA